MVQSTETSISPIDNARNEVAKRMAWMVKVLKRQYEKETG